MVPLYLSTSIKPKIQTMQDCFYLCLPLSPTRIFVILSARFLEVDFLSVLPAPPSVLGAFKNIHESVNYFIEDERN